MLDPKRHRQLEELNTVELCVQLLYTARNELYVNMHFLDVALSSLRFEASSGATAVSMQLPAAQNGRTDAGHADTLAAQQQNTAGANADAGATNTLAVDGDSIFYQPAYLLQLYQKGRVHLNRAYLHMVLHCLFGHLWNYGTRDPQLWNLACDIAAEHLIDAQALPCLHVPPAAAKREMYLRLQKHGISVFSAELIYRKLKELSFDARRLQMLQQIFYADDHSAWYAPDKAAAAQNRQSQWQDRREKMQTAIETGTREPSEGTQNLQENLSAANRERYDYRRFLKRFAVLREENGVDPDSFDPIFYTFGLSHYGNMPLIEPQETKEVFAVEDFVIVIDTSMSTNGALVQRFLEETCSVLAESGSYFCKVNVHILQCDDAVRADAVIHSAEELKAYMEHFTLNGNGGTDFRPAFAYVDGLLQAQRFKKLKGLLYFTDGKGIYPQKSTPYDTAFVFIEDNYEDVSVPPWAMKLILTEDELLERYEAEDAFLAAAQAEHMQQT